MSNLVNFAKRELAAARIRLATQNDPTAHALGYALGDYLAVVYQAELGRWYAATCFGRADCPYTTLEEAQREAERLLEAEWDEVGAALLGKEDVK